MDQLTNQIVNRALSRRGFLAGAGVATAATLTGCGGSTTTTPTQPTTPPATALTDVDVINFALNLEYLEAEFYLRAVTGQGVPTADGGAGSNVNISFTGPVAGFSSANAFYQQIAVEFAQQELQHIRTLRAALTAAGATPISSPALDYTTGFTGLATAAGLTGFNPFASMLNYFSAALGFEDNGVEAYTGAAALLTNTQNLNVAAGIQAAEAYHSASLRTLIVATGDSTVIGNYNKLIAARGTLGGSTETQVSIGGAGKASVIVQADPNTSVGYARSVDNVLHIAYGATGAGLSKGGFFPAGLNGNIKTTAS
ncbi:ferritin-like domain-containing protein [Terriglobus aquaticus]|uniref:Ferritin-like domain-containing protein n=1 Tax=Terriglobus aquaticus TaxID=940139 RepID=A0ABW9KN58_9BACT|nr:ferritin-like domain-containing protein [Terriglobus aquaticus]